MFQYFRIFSMYLHQLNQVFNRLFVKEVESETVETEIQSDYSSENERVLDLDICDRDKLADAINAALKNKNKKTETKISVNQKINLQKELKMYESTGNITNNLEK